jgi:spermine/spermidine synthase
VDLFLISFVILFLQLACIRWFGATVVFMTFFTNVVLMACFLGMSVGCLAASRKQNFVDYVIPMSLVTFVLAYGVLWVYTRFGDRMMIGVGGQLSPQEVFFGTEYGANDPSRFIVPIEVIAGAFYLLIAMMFLGLGQEMGRAFNATTNRVAAYTSNIGGSLAGIGAFALASHFHTTPLLWFGLSLGVGLYFVKSRRSFQTAALAGVIVFLAWTSSYERQHGLQPLWSPYYKILYEPRLGSINTNNIGHQQMVRLEEAGSAYVLPYLLNRDAGEPVFEDVLIIGAGSGNDVQAARSQGVRHIDAVEIDPVLYDIGRRDHPNHPYADPRVTIHFDDGRSFVRTTSRQYDLIVYALVDSLVLHSGYSSLRLESFLFTDQAFRDIKARLKPRGIFAIYNYFRQGWVIGRLEKTAAQVFGARPVVLSLPYQQRITPGDNQSGFFTVLIVGTAENTALQAIRHRLANGSFWLNRKPGYNQLINGYDVNRDNAGSESEDWRRIGLASIETTGIDRIPTDDWPFLYLRDRTVPALNVRGMAIIAIVSVCLLYLFAPVRTLRLNWQMFFLGAGFMLLETKGVVHMALLFGATWVVNSIVFFAILLMILMSNVYVVVVQPRTVWPYYGLLITSLLLNAYVPMSTFLALPGAARIVVSCSVIFVPVFFAGIVFATTFRDSRQPHVDFGSNIGGIILGGLSEHLSLIVGFDHLLLIAVGLYLASAVWRPRGIAVPARVG